MKRIEEFLGRAIRARREKMGVSQERFAVQAGVHRTYMSAIERGKVAVSVAVAAQVAKALGVTLSALFKDVEKMQSKEPS
jgi:transcriptional regulator with XRE-family HTH domain